MVIQILGGYRLYRVYVESGTSWEEIEVLNYQVLDDQLYFYSGFDIVAVFNKWLYFKDTTNDRT